MLILKAKKAKKSALTYNLFLTFKPRNITGLSTPHSDQNKRYPLSLWLITKPFYKTLSAYGRLQNLLRQKKNGTNNSILCTVFNTATVSKC